MKKKIIFLILTFFSFVGYCILETIPTYAQERILSGFGVAEDIRLFSGYLYDPDDLTEDMGRVEYYFSGYCSDGIVKNTLPGTFKGQRYDLCEYFYMEEGCVVEYKISFNDVVFFDIKIEEYQAYDFIEDYRFDVCEYFDDYSQGYRSPGKDSIISEVVDADTNIASATISAGRFSFMRCSNYLENTAYSGKELHVVMDHDAPITKSDLTKLIQGKDSSGANVSIEVKGLDEKIEELPLGVYPFTIYATDIGRNISFQRVYLDVIERNCPVIEENIKLTAYHAIELEEDSIYDELDKKIEDESEYTFTFDITEYQNNYDVCGEYVCDLSVIDIYGNQSDTTFAIQVIDSTKPVFGTYTSLEIPNSEQKDINDFLSDITATDDVTATENLVFTIQDLNNYSKKYYIPGDYIFRITVKDEAGNSNYIDRHVYVRDNEYPTIEIIDYTVVLNPGEKLSKEDILAALESLGRDITGVTLNSTYFDAENPSGEYIIEVSYPDGTICYDKIVMQSSDISYDVPIKVEEEKGSSFMVVAIIGGSILILCSIMGVVIFKKRH